MNAIGTLLAIVVDLALPVLLAVLLARANFRHRASRRGELVFWIAVGAYVAFLTAWAAAAIAATVQYNGYPTLTAVFVALPLSAIPSAFNSFAIHYFFSTAEWRTHGYVTILTIFLAGLPVWAVLAPLGIRRMIQYENAKSSARAALSVASSP